MRMTSPAANSLGRYVTDTGSLDEGTEVVRSSYAGVAFKVGAYLLVTLVAAVLGSWWLFTATDTFVIVALIAGPLVALIAGIIALRVPSTSAVLGSVYCLFYGLAIGAIAAILEWVGYGGLVLMALLCTVIVAGVMSLLYFSGTVKVGSKFKRVVFTAIIALVLSQLMFFLLSLFIPSVSAFMAFSDGFFWIQLAVCSLMIIFAACMILIDLDHITAVVEEGLGKKYEWRAAFSLMITLIWLFMQILRFLLLIASKRR